MSCPSLKSPQDISTEDSLKKAAAEGQRRARLAAQRGKSMEELGTSKITRLPAISRSSEELDQLRSLNGPGGFSGEQREATVRRAQGQQRDTQAEHTAQPSAEKPESVPIIQGHAQNLTQGKRLIQQNSDPGDDPSVVTRSSSSSMSPTSPSSFSVGVLSGPQDPASDTSTPGRPPSEAWPSPPSPVDLEASECESNVATPPSPTQTNPICESRSSPG